MGSMTSADVEYRRYAALLYDIPEDRVTEQQMLVSRAIGKGFTYQLVQACKGELGFNKAQDSTQEYTCDEVRSFHYYRTRPHKDSNATTFLYISVMFYDHTEIHLTTPSSFKNGYIEKRGTVPNKCFIHDIVADVKSSCEKLGFWL